MTASKKHAIKQGCADIPPQITPPDSLFDKPLSLIYLLSIPTGLGSAALVPSPPSKHCLCNTTASNQKGTLLWYPRARSRRHGTWFGRFGDLPKKYMKDKEGALRPKWDLGLVSMTSLCCTHLGAAGWSELMEEKLMRENLD
ncbi:hypothetical protein GN956_G6812 [Arapaima gigas]